MDNNISNDVEIYQLRAYIKKISPLIWRRVLVRSDSTIADLHYILQIAFGLSNSYLHQFVIRGKRYGISWEGGIWFSDNPYKLKLNHFHFRLKERFLYEYNFFVNWEFEVRMEKTLLLNSKKTYPVCIGGARAAPPENCNGPGAFMSFKQKYCSFYLYEVLTDMVNEEGDMEFYMKELRAFTYWLNTEHFDRRTVNQWLKLYGKGDKNWEKAFWEEII